MAMHELFLDFFFPRQGITECDLDQLKPQALTEESSSLRARGIQSLDRLTAAFDYNNSEQVQSAITALKYGRQTQHVDALANHLASVVVPTVHDAILCAVPLHWMRHFSRGFNQSKLLAYSLSSLCNFPVQHLLKRTRSTGFQAHRTREQRLKALTDSFATVSQKIPSHIILIDDLCTTGATLDACAITLKNAGAKLVEAWVVARA